MNNKQVLLGGDILAIGIVTVVGFATHGETGFGFLPRMFVAFIPLTLSWFLVAVWFDLFRPEITSTAGQLWRPAYAMILAGPLAVVLRGLILNTSIIPVFAVVLSATSAFGMFVWRSLYFLLSRRSG